MSCGGTLPAWGAQWERVGNEEEGARGTFAKQLGGCLGTGRGGWPSGGLGRGGGVQQRAEGRSAGAERRHREGHSESREAVGTPYSNR